VANVHWEEQKSREQLDDAGIILEPSDSWKNQNTRFHEEHDPQHIVEVTFCDVAQFYFVCGGIFAAVYGLGKWLFR
jgi:hypothetical protein